MATQDAAEPTEFPPRIEEPVLRQLMKPTVESMLTAQSISIAPSSSKASREFGIKIHRTLAEIGSNFHVVQVPGDLAGSVLTLLTLVA